MPRANDTSPSVLLPHIAYPHEWEKVEMSTGKKVKRCKLCQYTYEFGCDMPCPSKMPKKVI